MKLFKNLYDYRELLKTNVKKDIRGKYKGSFLGVLWSFLNPLLMVAVYAIVFPYIMRIKTDNYLQYLILRQVLILSVKLLQYDPQQKHRLLI